MSNKGPLDLSKIPPTQLASLSKQFSDEYARLSNSIAQLEKIVSKYQSTKKSLEGLSEKNKGKQILVPITESIYVRGEMNDIETVLIDIGTGYYVEKKVNEAEEYINRQIAMVENNIKILAKQRDTASENYKAIESYIYLQYMQSQRGGAAPPGAKKQ